MAKFSLFKGANNGTTNSSNTTFQEKNGHQKRPSSTRRSSYESATQKNGVVLAKNERWEHAVDQQHPPGHSRPASINATFEDGVVMESGFRGYLVVFGGFLVILAAIGYVSIYGIFQAKYNEIY
ncbi:hypothetical protein BGZ94_004932, partial [Podila epigama]